MNTKFYRFLENIQVNETIREYDTIYFENFKIYINKYIIMINEVLYESIITYIHTFMRILTHAHQVLTNLVRPLYLMFSAAVHIIASFVFFCFHALVIRRTLAQEFSCGTDKDNTSAWMRY